MALTIAMASHLSPSHASSQSCPIASPYLSLKELEPRYALVKSIL